MAQSQNNNEFLKTLQSKLLESQKGIVTSEPTEIDKTIEEAIGRIEKGAEAREAGIEAGFERQRLERAELGEERLETQRERFRFLGAASQTAVLGRIEEQTEKSLRDLDLREKEALAAGQLESAQQISALKVQQLQFRIQSQQQAFQNILATGQFELQKEAGERAERAQSFTERQSIANIALQFGLEIKPGETIDDITSRAMPFASEKQQLEFQSLREQIAKTKAETQRILRGEDSDRLDPEIIDAIATAANINPSVLGTMKNPRQVAAVINRMEELNQPRIFTTEDLTALATRKKAENKSFSVALGEIAANPLIINKEGAELVLRRMYGKPEGESFFEKLSRKGRELQLQESKEALERHKRLFGR